MSCMLVGTSQSVPSTQALGFIDHSAPCANLVMREKKCQFLNRSINIATELKVTMNHSLFTYPQGVGCRSDREDHQLHCVPFHTMEEPLPRGRPHQCRLRWGVASQLKEPQTKGSCHFMDPRAPVARVLKSISMITHLLHPVMLHTWFQNNFAHTVRTIAKFENDLMTWLSLTFPYPPHFHIQQWGFILNTIPMNYCFYFAFSRFISFTFSFYSIFLPLWLNYTLKYIGHESTSKS